MNTITLEVTRIVLAIGVFAIGVELPKQYMKKHWRSLFFLLVPTMTYVSAESSFYSINADYVTCPGVVCLRRVDIFSYTGVVFPLIPSSWCLLDANRPDSSSRRYWGEICRQACSCSSTSSYVIVYSIFFPFC